MSQACVDGKAVKEPNPGVAMPRGSKYPVFKDSGLKNHTLNGVLKCWVLGALG